MLAGAGETGDSCDARVWLCLQQLQHIALQNAVWPEPCWDSGLPTLTDQDFPALAQAAAGVRAEADSGRGGGNGGGGEDGRGRGDDGGGDDRGCGTAGGVGGGPGGSPGSPPGGPCMSPPPTPRRSIRILQAQAIREAQATAGASTF